MVPEVMEMEKTMTIGQFSKLSGVSQRTLRFYEEKGMLRPSYVSETGRRYYTADDLIPLQQIITLKYLGFPLDEISQMLARQTGSLKDNLLAQKQAIEQKRRHLDQIIKALDHAVAILDVEESIDPSVFSFLIQSIISENQQMEYLAQVFPEQTFNHIRQLFSDKDKELEWNKRSASLFHSLKQVIGLHPPESDEVQALVEELFRMTDEMFGGNWQVLNAAASKLEDEELPGFFTSPFTPEEERFVQEACEYYMKQKGLIPDA